MNIDEQPKNSGEVIKQPLRSFESYQFAYTAKICHVAFRAVRNEEPTNIDNALNSDYSLKTRS